MTGRKEILEKLLEFNAPLRDIINMLDTFGWDSDFDLMRLQRDHLRNVLNRYLDDELSASDVEAWANALESREDIGFEEGYEDLISSTIFELANPLLTTSLTTQRAKELLERFK